MEAATWAQNSSGGDNAILNDSGIGWSIYGSNNFGNGSSGGNNTITNGQNGSVGYAIIGSWNHGDGSSGQDNTLVNFGLVHDAVYGGLNDGNGSTGGENQIWNYGKHWPGHLRKRQPGHRFQRRGETPLINAQGGIVDGAIIGSRNSGQGSAGQENTIVKLRAGAGGDLWQS